MVKKKFFGMSFSRRIQIWAPLCVDSGEDISICHSIVWHSNNIPIQSMEHTIRALFGLPDDMRFLLLDDQDGAVVLHPDIPDGMRLRMQPLQSPRGNVSGLTEIDVPQVKMQSNKRRMSRIADMVEDQDQQACVDQVSQLLIQEGKNQQESEEKAKRVKNSLKHKDEFLWKRLLTNGEVPAKRWGHVMIACEGKTILYGGSDDKASYNDIHVFDHGKTFLVF